MHIYYRLFCLLFYLRCCNLIWQHRASFHCSYKSSQSYYILFFRAVVINFDFNYYSELVILRIKWTCNEVKNKNTYNFELDIHNRSTFFKVASVFASREKSLAFFYLFLLFGLFDMWYLATLASFNRRNENDKQNVIVSRGVGAVYEAPMTTFICSLVYCASFY